MKRRHAHAPNIGPKVQWTGRHYLKLTPEERALRDELRRQIKAEGVLAAHQEYLRRLPARLV